jgi:hypothetical protein
MSACTAEMVDGICQLQAIQALAHRRQLRLIACYDRAETWREDGATSMTAWLAYMLNTTHETAAEEVRVAHALDELPAIGRTYGNGELSRDQVRALTRFATPETDETLAAEAQKMSAAQTYRMARRCRPVTLEEEREAHRTRSLKLWWDEHLLHLSGRLPKAEGAVVAKALERIAMQARPDPLTDLYAPYEQRCADALFELASTRLAEDADADRATVALHVEARVLAGFDGVAELEDGDAIAVETARRLACDARWYVVVDGPDGEPIGVGRTTRQVPAWLLRELKRRDVGCKFPGCGRRRWVAAHHIVHWANGGPTDMDNLVLLCGTHHRLVHEGGAQLALDADGEPSFALPNGRVVSASGPPALRDDLRRRLAGETAPAPPLLDTG